jgi:hypothetical protein
MQALEEGAAAPPPHPPAWLVFDRAPQESCLRAATPTDAESKTLAKAITYYQANYA